MLAAVPWSSCSESFAGGAGMANGGGERVAAVFLIRSPCRAILRLPYAAPRSAY